MDIHLLFISSLTSPNTGNFTSSWKLDKGFYSLSFLHLTFKPIVASFDITTYDRGD